MNGENYKYFKDIYDKMLIMQKEIYKLVEILRKNEKITDAQFSDVLDISAEMVANDDTIKAAKSIEPHPDGVTFVFDPEKVERDAVKKTCDKIIEDYKSIQGDQTLKEFFEKRQTAKCIEKRMTPDGVEFIFAPEDLEREAIEKKKPGRQNGRKLTAENVARNLAKRWTLAAASSTPNKAARDLLLQAFAELEKDERDTNPEG